MSNPIKLAVAGAGIMATVLVGTNLLVVTKVTKLEDELRVVKGQVTEANSQIKETKAKVAVVEKVVLYKTQEKVALTDKEMHCLVKNIFHEAGVEDRAGKIAVAQVTINRLKSGRWGKNLCDVVYAKAQFSWTLDRKRRWSQPKGELWEASAKVAHEFAQGRRVRGLEDSGFYHTNYINQPDWARTKKVVHRIGQHIFYKGIDS